MKESTARLCAHKRRRNNGNRVSSANMLHIICSTILVGCLFLPIYIAATQASDEVSIYIIAYGWHFQWLVKWYLVERNHIFWFLKSTACEPLLSSLNVRALHVRGYHKKVSLLQRIPNVSNLLARSWQPIGNGKILAGCPESPIPVMTALLPFSLFRYSRTRNDFVDKLFGCASSTPKLLPLLTIVHKRKCKGDVHVRTVVGFIETWSGLPVESPSSEFPVANTFVASVWAKQSEWLANDETDSMSLLSLLSWPW